MNRRSNIVAACFTVSLATLSGFGCGNRQRRQPRLQHVHYLHRHADGHPLSFATDIYPIFAGTAAPGRLRAGADLPRPPMLALDPGNTKYLTFLFGTIAAPVPDAGMARAQLLTPSVNAPSMHAGHARQRRQELPRLQARPGQERPRLRDSVPVGRQRRRQQAVRRPDAEPRTSDVHGGEPHEDPRLDRPGRPLASGSGSPRRRRG